MTNPPNEFIAPSTGQSQAECFLRQVVHTAVSAAPKTDARSFKLEVGKETTSVITCSVQACNGLV